MARLIRRLSARRATADTAWRDAIRLAIDQGATLREVAAVAGITHTAVANITRGAGS